MRYRIALALLLGASLTGLVAFAPSGGSANLAPLRDARNRQDRAALGRLSQEFLAQAKANPNQPEAQYNGALSLHYLAEVALEVQDKPKAREAAEAAIPLARKAVELRPNVAEYHRILGALCGQVIPANLFAGLKYGQCALDSVNKAIELDPKSSNNWLSHGVGNLYLPESFGGGIDLAIKDFQKATSLDSRNADAWAWLGVAYRRQKQFDEAKKAFQRSLDLNPKREWVRQQMTKALMRQ